MSPYIVHLCQAVVGAALVYCIRNDWDEKIGGVAIGRSKWTLLALVAAALAIGTGFTFIGFAKLVVALGLIGYILTAPHGQTLRGPHQDIPADEDDPVFEAAMFITGHRGGAGDVFGWPAWLVYNGIRYVLPCALLGALLHSPVTAVSGVLIVASYWPIAFVPAIRQRWDTRFFGAGCCGFWLFLGL